MFPRDDDDDSVLGFIRERELFPGLDDVSDLFGPDFFDITDDDIAAAIGDTSTTTTRSVTTTHPTFDDLLREMDDLDFPILNLVPYTTETLALPNTGIKALVTTFGNGSVFVGLLFPAALPPYPGVKYPSASAPGSTYVPLRFFTDEISAQKIIDKAIEKAELLTNIYQESFSDPETFEMSVGEAGKTKTLTTGAIEKLMLLQNPWHETFLDRQAAARGMGWQPSNELYVRHLQQVEESISKMLAEEAASKTAATKKRVRANPKDKPAELRKAVRFSEGDKSPPPKGRRKSGRRKP